MQTDLGKTLGRNGAPHHRCCTRAANQQTQILVRECQINIIMTIGLMQHQNNALCHYENMFRN